MKSFFLFLMVVIGFWASVFAQANAGEVLVIEGDVIRGNEEQPMVTHILPWVDQSPAWSDPVAELQSVEDALLSPIEPSQIRNEVESIREIISNKKQRTSDE